ncbi:hypothetical protein ACHAPU_010199 [Fusarium lateritium]
MPLPNTLPDLVIVDLPHVHRQQHVPHTRPDVHPPLRPLSLSPSPTLLQDIQVHPHLAVELYDDLYVLGGRGGKVEEAVEVRRVLARLVAAELDEVFRSVA